MSTFCNADAPLYAILSTSDEEEEEVEVENENSTLPAQPVLQSDISHYTTSYHITSYHDTTDHITLYNITSYRIISHHITSHHQDNHQLFASGSDDCTAIVWDQRSKKQLQSIYHDYQVTAVCMAADGNSLYTGGLDSIIR